MKKDYELIKSFQSGSQTAFNELATKHLDNVYQFFLKYTNNPMEAEDLTQDVFIKLYKSLKRFRFEAEFKTYLFRINLNTAHSFIQRNRWRSMLHLDEVPDSGEKDKNLETGWTKTDVWNSVSRLPKQQRMIVMMRISQELPYKNIGALLKISENSAKVNYHHGMKKLKKWLGDSNEV